MKNMKEVCFNEYCKTCKYEAKSDHEGPCNECLDYPANENSHKPVGWKEKK